MDITDTLNLLECENNTEQLQNLIELNEFKTKVIRNNKILEILHFNVCSAPRHFDEILIFLQSCNLQNVDILILGETRNNFTADQFNIPGFTTFFNNSNLTQNDGLLIFVNNKISFNVKHTVLPESLVTLSQIILKIENISFNVIAGYRSPSTSEQKFVTDLEIFLSNLPSKDFTIIIGDMNINILNNNSHIANNYLAFLMSLGFKSYINTFTRVTQETSSCLDHIFIKQNLNSTNINLDSAVVNNNTTDHYPIYLQVYNKTYKKPPSLEKTISIFDHKKFKELISQETWHSVLTVNDVKAAWSIFYKTFNEIYEQCRTTKTSRMQKFHKIKPWITNAIITSIKKRDTLKKDLIKNKNNVALNQRYKIYRNNLKRIINEAKARYYREKVNNSRNDMKKIYNIINEATNTNSNKNNDINIFNINKQPFQNKKQMADFCNDYFIQIGKKMALKIQSPINYKNSYGPGVKESMLLKPVTPNELIIHIASLKNKSSPGYDNIKAELIKDNHLYLICPLAHIINLIFLQGEVPEDFKKSIVTPIYKSGDKNEISNYRPISLISVFAKIFEKCLKDRLFDFCKKNKILNENQFGFRTGISTNHAIYTLVDSVKLNLEKSKKCIGVFLDLAKAFDTVPHRKLLDVLEHVGARGTVLKVFSSYLQDRVQQVRINDHLSDYQKIQVGIPQGTVLGPLLFIIYINSLLEKDIQGNIISYADDTVLVFEDDTWQGVKAKAEAGIGVVKDWLDFNELTLNVDKSKYISFSLTDTNRPNFTFLQLPGTSFKINEVNSIKYLGIIIDKNLKWSIHVNNLCTKIRRLVYKFYEIRKFMSKKLLRIIYKSLVESILQYAIIVWGGLYTNALEPLNVIQNYILKIMLQKKKRYPTDLLYSVEILNVRMLYFYNSCLFLYKNKNMQQKLHHTYQTRQTTNQNLAVPFYRKDGNQRFAKSLAPKIFNSLPVYLKNITNYKRFAALCRPLIYKNYKTYLSLL